MVQNRNITESTVPRGTLYGWSVSAAAGNTVHGFLWDGKNLVEHTTHEIISWSGLARVRTTGGIYELGTQGEFFKVIERGLRQ